MIPPFFVSDPQSITGPYRERKAELLNRRAPGNFCLRGPNSNAKFLLARGEFPRQFYRAKFEIAWFYEWMQSKVFIIICAGVMMNSTGTHYRNAVAQKLAGVVLLILLFIPTGNVVSQARIQYAGRNIFISGINIAWVNFSGDIGPNPPNLAQFQTEFQTVHSNGGNVMRFWLNTNGTQTPVFDANGFVTGPGPIAIQSLKQILALAHQYNIGLILCLWSHDMQNQSQMDTAGLHRNAKLLNDTAYTNAYIRNALIPMVDSVKGNPAIVAWEIFNEPEGITNEFGWSGDDHVPFASIQRCVNLMAGAIHRTDPTALVTSGAVTFQTLTDVPTSGTVEGGLNKSIGGMSAGDRQIAAQAFNARHRLSMTDEEYLDYIQKTSAASNSNYYRDDRLKAAGGDTLGTLDFYCVHYYAQGTPLSPFVHPASFWGLTKPIVAAEFYMQATDGVPALSLYPWLYNNGYAGAMMWSWTDFGNPVTNSAADTWTSLNYMFANYRNDVITNPTTGSIYVFSATPGTIEKTDTTMLRWDTEPGSVVKLDGSSVSVKDSVLIHPLVTTTYTLTASGVVQDTAKFVLTVLPTGRIVNFKALPAQVGTGEPVSLIWHVVKGSAVTLNGATVPTSDSISVVPDPANGSYTLIGKGDEEDSITIQLQILPPDQVDRAYQAYVTASSNDTVAYSFSDPQHVTDGNNFSRWQAASTPVAQWVLLDFARTDTINKVVIRWGNSQYAKLYYVQTSLDRTNWSVIIDQENGTGGTGYVETWTGFNTVARYLELVMVGQGSNGVYSVAEISAYGSLATGVRTDNSQVPVVYSLSQNYPNPFNPATTIKYSLANPQHVKLVVYDLLGRQVASLVNEKQIAGEYSVRFDARTLASGMYFYRIEAGSFTQVRKMMLIK